MGRRVGNIVRSAAMLVTLAVTPVWAQMPQATTPPDGTWLISGRATPGMRCADWFVRITKRGSQLSGIVGLSQGNVPIYGMQLQPDGTFSGTTQAGHVNARAVRAYEVNGQFYGSVLAITLENEICPMRSGSSGVGRY